MQEKFFKDTNTIFELKHEYVANSVTATLDGDDVDVVEVGGRYVSVEAEGVELVVSYQTHKDVLVKPAHIKAYELETEVERLKLEVAELRRALDNRVTLNSFNTWLKSLEAKLGIKVIEQSFHSPYPHQ